MSPCVLGELRRLRQQMDDIDSRGFGSRKRPLDNVKGSVFKVFTSMLCFGHRSLTKWMHLFKQNVAMKIWRRLLQISDLKGKALRVPSPLYYLFPEMLYFKIKCHGTRRCIP